MSAFEHSNDLYFIAAPAVGRRKNTIFTLDHLSLCANETCTFRLTLMSLCFILFEKLLREVPLLNRPCDFVSQGMSAAVVFSLLLVCDL